MILKGIAENTEALRQQDGQPKGEQEGGESDAGKKKFERIQFNPDEFDEKTIAQFDALQDILEKQQNEIESLKEQDREKGEQNFENQFDWFIDTLGAEYEDTFGKGPGRSVGRSELANRQRVVAKMNVIEAGLLATNQKVNLREVFEQALAIEFSDVKAKKVKDEIKTKVKNRSKQATIPPTSRKMTDSRTPEGKALDTITSYLNKAGY